MVAVSADFDQCTQGVNLDYRETDQIEHVVLGLDTWLDSMRQSGGYGGPVVHWWNDCLLYTGPGLDWRYEGVILGYLCLWEKTGQRIWLDKAIRAGDDLIAGQLPSGTFRNSSFELNPNAGGTPHEAACDIALIKLAETLKKIGDQDWKRYKGCAIRNILEYYISLLWDDSVQSFRDHPDIPSFVPNKAATLCEALFALADLTGEERWIQEYALPTLEAVMAHQIAGGDLDGAIYQNSFRGRLVEKFFPFYITRCIPALLLGYEYTDEQRYIDSAVKAMTFVLHFRFDDGSFPQVVYPKGRINRYPQWVAAVGDILRILRLMQHSGFETELEPTLDWFMDGQLPGGGFRAAHGFASQVSQKRPGHSPELRDLLPVVGWNDKAFRYLCEQIPENNAQLIANKKCERYEINCTFRGRPMLFWEDDKFIQTSCNEQVYYRWCKGSDWAELVFPEFLLK